MRASIRIAMLVGALSFSLEIEAYELVPDASVSTLFSDNVARTSTGTRSDVALTTTADLLFETSTEQLAADVKVGDSYRYYIDHTAGSEQLPAGSALVSWRIIPERFSWEFEDDFGQVANEPFMALDPTDRENTNLLITGPTATFPLGSRTTLELDGRGTEVYYSRSNIDSDRLSGGGFLQYDFSPRHRLSLHSEYGKTYFRYSDLYQDYSQQKTFVRFESSTRLMSLRLDAGETGYQAGPLSSDHALVDFTAYRLIGAYTKLGAEYTRGLSDASEEFRKDTLNSELDSGDINILTLAEPFLVETYSVFLSSEQPVGSLRLYAYEQDDHYQALSIYNRKLTGAAFDGARNLNARDRISLTIDYERDDDDNGGDVAELWGAKFEYSHAITPTLRVDATVERYMRRSAFEGPYTENRVGLYLYYQALTRLPKQVFAPYRSNGLRLPASAAPNTIPDVTIPAGEDP